VDLEDVEVEGRLRSADALTIPAHADNEAPSDQPIEHFLGLQAISPEILL
jgi:hypothetical protein